MEHFRVAVSLAVLFAVVTCVSAEEKKENYPDGKVKASYDVDAEGKKQGKFLEYYESGTIHIRAEYRDDQLDGMYIEYFESGPEKIRCKYKAGQLDGKYVEKDEKRKTLITANYENGKLHGEYKMNKKKIAFPGQVVPAKKLFFIDGQLAYPKSEKYIEETLAGIYGKSSSKKKKKKSDKKGDSTGPGSANHQEALKNLKAYRFLCDLPYEDVVLDEELNKYGKAGAEICAAIGKLSHTPANPGWPKERYDYAYHATTHSNLHMSSKGGGEALIPGSVHGYMDDSDEHNISRVGHRRWCLNPNMAKVGFGGSDKFSAMMAHDNSRTPAADWDIIYYPARGYMHRAYFSSNHAWCVLFNPNKYTKGSKATIKVNVYKVDKKYKKDKKPINLGYFNVDVAGYGYNWAIIFRPGDFSTSSGSRYWVEIEGVTKTSGEKAEIAYLVEFFGEESDSLGNSSRRRR